MNPYYLAWCKATGTDAQKRLDSYHEFMAWIGRKHREYRKLKGLPLDRYPSGDYAEEFTDWLNKEETV